MRATLVFSTARPEPRLDWLIDDLVQQARPGDEIELVVVDALGRSAGELGGHALQTSSALHRVVVTAPKPTPWQGPQRVTSCDWWAASSARNTGAVLATTEYLAFVDDRCHLGPGWLAGLRTAFAERRSVVAGSYERHEDGKTTQDHRWLEQPGGLPNCGGSWLFGCTVCLPLAWFLAVNGFEEGCDGLSGEDSVLGLMLTNAGYRIDFRPTMKVVQERSAGTSHHLARADKGISPRDKSHAAIARFGPRRRTEFTADLRELRARVASGHGFPDVDLATEPRDWYDGQPICKMVPPP